MRIKGPRSWGATAAAPPAAADLTIRGGPCNLLAGRGAVDSHLLPARQPQGGQLQLDPAWHHVSEWVGSQRQSGRSAQATGHSILLAANAAMEHRYACRAPTLRVLLCKQPTVQWGSVHKGLSSLWQEIEGTLACVLRPALSKHRRFSLQSTHPFACIGPASHPSGRKDPYAWDCHTLPGDAMQSRRGARCTVWRCRGWLGGR
jgi:hypothetical protein